MLVTKDIFPLAKAVECIEEKLETGSERAEFT